MARCPSNAPFETQGKQGKKKTRSCTKRRPTLINREWGTLYGKAEEVGTRDGHNRVVPLQPALPKKMAANLVGG
jgi:hypothetical protein